MINFAWPWFACLLPLPLLVFWLMKAKKNQHIVINASTLPYLANNVTGSTSRHRFSQILLIISWSLFILIMTRPQWLDAPIVQTSPSRDLLLAVDVSYSMQIKDM
jgi:Ca-activated chloride channel family protein